MSREIITGYGEFTKANSSIVVIADVKGIDFTYVFP